MVSVGEVVAVMRGAIFQIMLMAAPVLLISLLVGLVVSIFQATTSIQEQTLTFVPKIAAIFITLMIFGGRMVTSLREYTLALMDMIPGMVN